MYRHVQLGTLMLALMGGIAVAVIAAFSLAHVAVGLSIASFLLILGLLFYSLGVEVDGHAIRLWFGIGLIRRTIDANEVKDVQVVKNSWLYGWGIRLTPHGWMWNVSGLDAVELTYQSGKKFRIGTDEPAKLARVIRRAAHLPEDEG